MKSKVLNALLIAFVLSLGWSTAWSAQAPYPANATFTTLALTEFSVEGLTGDGTYLYTAGTQIAATNAQSCPVYRVPLAGGSPVIVGYIPARRRRRRLSFAVPQVSRLTARGIFMSPKAGLRLRYLSWIRTPYRRRRLPHTLPAFQARMG